MNKNTTTFPISKSKALFITLLATGALVALVWLAYFAIMISESLYDRGFVAGVFLFLAFGAALYALYGIKSLFGAGRGIIVGDEGLTVDVGTGGGYFIRWAEITNLKINTNIYSPIYLMIFIKNPNRLIDKARGLQKFQLKMNAFRHSTPVKIRASALDCKFSVLLMAICNRYYDFLTVHDNQKMKTDIETILTEYIEIKKELWKVYFRLLMVFLLVVVLVLVLIWVLF